MLRRALLVAAVIGLAAAYSTGNNYNDNDRYGNNYNDNNNHQYRQMNNNHSMPRTKDIFCFLNATNIVRQPYHEGDSETRGPFTINNMKSELCTHIIYNAIEMDLNNNNIRAIDSELERNSGSRPTFAELNNLKNKNPQLKLILSLSGRATDFADLARNKNYHSTFAKNVASYLKKYNFDGVNIDWQYPEIAHREFLSIFMNAMKVILRKEGLLLTTVLPPRISEIQNAYDQSMVFEAVDYWFIMTTDFSQNWSYVKPPTPMRSRDSDDVKNSIDNYKKLFNNYSYKLILVISFGGKLITSNHELFDGTPGRGKAEQEEPFPYNKICKTISHGGWQKKWDDDADTPIAHLGNRVFAYDNEESVKIKTRYAIKSGLGGVMAYTIDMDDYEGVCRNSGPVKKYNEQTYRSQDRSTTSFPLLQSIYDTVQRDPNSAGLHTSSLALVLATAFAMILKHQG